MALSPDDQSTSGGDAMRAPPIRLSRHVTVIREFRPDPEAMKAAVRLVLQAAQAARSEREPAEEQKQRE